MVKFINDDGWNYFGINIGIGKYRIRIIRDNLAPFGVFFSIRLGGFVKHILRE